MKPECIEGEEATEGFEKAMKQLFRAPKPPKHAAKKGKKKGKD
jgi:hypothetical protein